MQFGAVRFLQKNYICAPQRLPNTIVVEKPAHVVELVDTLP